ncbi:SDR family NAD(P)-dependent oxidoreductase [Nocardioides acrostichi]|uniref:SDR family NAD(P)-dependent oxidoreductase n=1 Tax=Nocardioides acrostichi TaxID=2784339 RepID=A0A930YBD8_9ACTN|nr:SDR family NAD(P)-dependent oxidoreductase [Nocardioides acrostichi]MBF4160389.1 SDR family NAD(P)-dependent oxidoreductase [Nocardioides acrostichi]
MSWSTADIPDLTGRTAVVTGANGGLGLASTRALAAAGAHVVMAARNPQKAADAESDVRLSVPAASLEVVPLDLSDLSSVESAAARILQTCERIDVLMLNAGVMASPQETTVDGFDRQLGTNVLGHWALLARLLPLVVGTAGARVVTLSSIAQHQGRPLDVADPHQRDGYDAWAMYGNTKLAMRHLGVGLDARFREAGLDARAVVAHPGLTNSELQATTAELGGGGWRGPFFQQVTERVGMSVPRGALSQLRAATDPSVRGGTMVGPRFGMAGSPVVHALVRRGSDGAVARLWEVCERETGLAVEVRPAS